MTTENNQLSVSQPENPFVRASTALSQQLGLEPRAMIDAIKTQFFKGKEATDAQLAVVVSTARALGLNPLLPGQLYPYPDRSGAVTIMLGPDGIFTLLANNPDIVAQKDGGAAYWTEHGKDAEGKATCTGFINHRTKGLLKKTIWTDEWSVSSNPNWASRKMHMSEIRALKQAARMVVHGIPPDSDEQKLSEMYNVTNTTEENNSAENAPAPERPAPKPRATRGAAGAKEQTTVAQDRAQQRGVEVVVTQDEQKASEQKPADAAPTQDIQQAMQAREAKTQSQGGDVKNEPTKLAGVANAPSTSGVVTPQVPSNPAPAATPPVVSRAFPTEGERYVTTAKVEEFKAIAANVEGQNVAAIRAMLSGGYVGEVRQKEGGAKFVNNNTEVVALPPWQVGAVLKFTLFGKKASNGKVIPWVTEISPVGVEAENLD